ncbi:MAG TPA: hypothetical protein VHO94_06360 [Oscillospiraceae bacterium]|nr:hypothetical protein [Oscillospiraceae bacterium]
MKNNIYINLFTVVFGLYLLYIAFYLIDKAAFNGKYFKRLPKPYFEGYVIKVYHACICDDVVYEYGGYFCRWEDGEPIFMLSYPRRFYTKFGAKLFARKICSNLHPCFVVRERWFM